MIDSYECAELQFDPNDPRSIRMSVKVKPRPFTNYVVIDVAVSL